MSDHKLKPCPFCNSKVELNTIVLWGQIVYRQRNVKLEKPTVAEAVTAWNTRYDPNKDHRN